MESRHCSVVHAPISAEPSPERGEAYVGIRMHSVHWRMAPVGGRQLGHECEGQRLQFDV